jgi:hypothetical protein
MKQLLRLTPSSCPRLARGRLSSCASPRPRTSSTPRLASSSNRSSFPSAIGSGVEARDCHPPIPQAHWRLLHIWLMWRCWRADVDEEGAAAIAGSDGTVGVDPAAT